MMALIFLGLALDYVIILVAVEQLHFNVLLSKAISTTIALSVNYILQKMIMVIFEASLIVMAGIQN